MNRILYLILLIVVVFPGCSSSDDYKFIRESKFRDDDGDILIGAVASWELEKNEYIWEGLQLALNEINGRGGVKGKKIRIVKKDDEGSLDKGLIHAKNLCSNTEIMAVLGHSYSYISIPCSALYQYFGLPMLSPTSDNPELSGRKGYDYIIQPSPVTDDFVNKLVVFLKKCGLKNIAIFNQNDSFGTKFGNYFEKIASRNDINTVARISYAESASNNFFKNRLLACSYFYDFDAILIAGDAVNALPLIKINRRFRIKGPIIGTEKFNTKDMIDVVKKTGKRVIFPSSFNVNSKSKKVQKFIEGFRENYKTLPRSSAARWYNALIFLANAMEKADKLSPRGIIDSIRKVKRWNGVLGDIVYDGRGYLKIVKDSININTIDAEGNIIEADHDSIKDLYKKR